MGEIVIFPPMVKTEWKREGETLLVIYHAGTKRVLIAPSDRLLYLPYEDVATMLIHNNWTQL